ncbi:OmpA family protein [Microbulbifer hydrolyticus]|uniref:OmpA family protein n=1 Tax=Microbulbifer hydrolyticus TaxID=48074 RepID=A0ABX6J2U5_9GAMM|nr:OmpA family protein [Microbulbifer hydrolyticus]QHQ40296.1 OmpA family protein [Microbulbifer hydrolyticus]
MGLAVFLLLGLLLPSASPRAQDMDVVNIARASWAHPGDSATRWLDSNSVSLGVLETPACTPSSVAFYQHVPSTLSAPDSVSRDFTGGSYVDTSGARLPLPVPTALDGSALSLGAVASRLAAVYHGGEPILIALEDGNRNIDPAVRESVTVELIVDYPDTGSGSGTAPPEREQLYLYETGPDTGVFAAALPSVAHGTDRRPQNGDGQLVLGENAQLALNYQDPMCSGEIARAGALADPLGVVFDSVDGTPLAGATVMLVNADDGSPALVYDDDGVTPFPSSQVTGGSGTPSFRFPYVPPGNYRLTVTPPSGYTAPSTAADSEMPPAPDGQSYRVVTGSRGETFSVSVSPALAMDVPVDPSTAGLLLEKRVSDRSAGAGDYLQYRLQLQSLISATASEARIVDRLPVGMRYRAGSLYLDGAQQADPTIGADGRTLEIPLGELAADAQLEVRYVVEVTAGVPIGEAVNTATASALNPGGGVMNSNLAQVAVTITEPFISDRFTLVGGVYGGDCDTPWSERKGLAGVRLLLDDGTYVVTDIDGRYHLEGLRPGTHVVQLDTANLPAGWEPVSCVDNTRFAGSAYSQFVDAQGGSLWRADFQLRPARAGLRLQTRAEQASPLLEKVAPTKYTFRGRFASGDDQLLPESAAELQALVETLQGGEVFGLEIVGHTDSQRLSRRARAKFRDNHGLSMARASTVANVLGDALGLSAERITVGGMGPSLPLADNFTWEGMARNRRVDVLVYGRTGPAEVVVGERLKHMHTVELDTSGGAFTNLRVTAMLPENLHYLPGTARLDGEPVDDPRQTGVVLMWRLPDGTGVPQSNGVPYARNFTFQTEELRRDQVDAGLCAAENSIKVNALVDTAAGDNLRLPVAENRLHCAESAGEQADGHAPQAGADTLENHRDSGRLTVNLTDPGTYSAPEEGAESAEKVSSAAAAGVGVDWLAQAASQQGFLFPPERHNPRAPAVRAVIAHGVGERVELTVNGKPAPALSYEGIETAPRGNAATSLWRALPLEEGDNQLLANVYDDRGELLASYRRLVHFANTPARAELLPERSDLRADGVSRPRIAVRILDRDGFPVRDGITGSVAISAPYEAWQSQNDKQQRKLAGMGEFQPQYRVEGDEGIAWIELAPTTRSGAFTLDFRFHTGVDTRREQQLHGWMAPAARDWVVVGFAEGTLGYNTLDERMESLPAGEDEGVYTDGQLSFYAKGRVLGQWLLTMAYDSDKPRDQALMSPIDPSRYYTLYGDGTTQVYGAASRDKLYVKMERGQFYALFGDYETGLVKTQLSRYSRTLNGFKAEDGAGLVVYTVFAADTEQSYARDEIQGDGTSGLYRLSYPGILLNSERVRIETRDRVHREQVLKTETLTPYIDYEIDYAAGTLFFREPVFSRDLDFNPVYIVAEYETSGGSNRALSGGGRVGLNLQDEKLQVGLSGLRDEGVDGRADLAGADLRWFFGDDSELRLEAAQTRGDDAGRDGEAWLAEVEHHSSRYDVLAYSRQQDAEFGLNQQTPGQAGQRKSGVQGQVHLGEQWSLQGEAYRQQNLANAARRNAAETRLRYETNATRISLGAQHAADELPASNAGEAPVEATSSQALFSASRQLLNGRADLSLQTETSLGGGSNESADYPDRYLLGASYALTDYARVLAGQEFSDGDSSNTRASRVGVQLTPWAGGLVTSTLNESRASGYGPRRYSQLGVSQAANLNEQWRLDLGLDASHALEGGAPLPAVNASTGSSAFGQSSVTSTSEDFVALSAGAAWRGDVWAWRGRLESRRADSGERLGLSSGFLRQAQAGIAFSSTLEAFHNESEQGASGDLASLDLSWAWRPLDSYWSILNRLEFRYESVENAAFDGGLFGFDSLAADNARSRRVINNFALNRVSRPWSGEDRTGNLFQRYQRSQLSLYYGAKYAQDNFDGAEYDGYTDLLGLEARYDLNEWMDLGLQASALNSWETGTHRYSFGPQLGFSPVRDGWVTLGWNLQGFHDRDFEAARYTAQGPYLQLRFKFDQNTRFGSGSESGE